MAIVVDHESEYKGEQKVRDAIAEHFSDEVVIYNNREVNGVTRQIEGGRNGGLFSQILPA